jgi:tetratricopeptide (TPR) repeat protein
MVALAGYAPSRHAAAAASHAPYSESELRGLETSDEAKLRSLRNDEVTQLRIALGRHAPANRRADLYLRLAEIYIEAYRADYLLEGRVHERRIERGESDPAIDHSHSKPHLKSGIEACKAIVGFNIPFSKMDEVYYFLGFNYSELGDRKQGVQYFNRLTQRFPGSRYVGEAYKEMGDAAFDGTEYRKAQAYYEMGIKHAAPDALPRLYHRLAWCYYRTKQFDRAVGTMKQAIDSAQANGEKYLSLREEALRDMAVFMTETGKTEEAIAYFAKVVDKKFYPEVLEKLGKQYERNVEPAKATVVYESLLKTNPDSEAGFRVRVKLVDLDLRRGHYKEALARVKGVKLPTDGDNDTQVAAQNLRAMIRRTATEHHEKSRKAGAAKSAELEIAESYYETYLGFLAQGDWRHETPEIQMYLAEVERERGRAKDASALYKAVLDSRDKRYAKEAGALWTASLAEAIRKQAASQPKNAPKPIEPSPLETEFVTAADSLQEALGDTTEGREAALQAAEVLAGYKDTQKDAKKRIDALIEKSPHSAQAVTAARLRLQLAVDDAKPGPNGETSGDASDIAEVMEPLKANAALMAADQKSGGKLKAQMAEQETRLKIGAIAQKERKQDFVSAGADYEKFAEDATSREVAEKAYANAIGSYLKKLEAEPIGRVSLRWLKRYPKSPQAIEAIRGAATRFLIAGNLPVTAQLFELLGRDAHDADALETAGRVYDGIGDVASARKARSHYLATYAGNPHYAGIALDLARSYDGGVHPGDDALAIHAYRECMADKSDLYAECGARLADLYMRIQKPADGKAAYRQVSAARGTASVKKAGKKAAKGKAKSKSKDAGDAAESPFVGYARFRLAVLLEQEAKFDRLEMPEANLKKALNQRLNFLEPLSRAYTSAVEAGGPWAVAALDRLAAWVLNFADEIDRINPPAQADSAAIARFRKGLSSVSDPLRRKAVASWADAYAKAAAVEALSPALPEIADHLADAKAPSPARAQGYRGRFRLAGMAATGGDLGKDKAFERTRERLGKNANDAAAWVDYGNLMWGDGKPLIARIAYERALALNPRSASALNNRGVVLISSEGEEDWLGALRGAILFRDALKQDEYFLAAKMNRAMLLNYYRLFAKAKPAWEQVLVRDSEADVQDGLAVALQGMGNRSAAAASFAKATDAGAPSKRFVAVYHDAARMSAAGGADAGAKCLDRAGDLDPAELTGFEKSALEHLKSACTIQKSEAKSK